MAKSEIDALIDKLEAEASDVEGYTGEALREAAAALRELVADRDSWEQQASDRIDDVLEQADRAERAEAECDDLNDECARWATRTTVAENRAKAAEAERDALVDWNRVLNEEMVNAGMQGGDRTTTLGNVRRLIAERDAGTKP